MHGIPLKDLTREANSLSRGARQTSALGWKGVGTHRELRTPLGMTKPLVMTKTITLWVSADLLGGEGGAAFLQLQTRKRGQTREEDEEECSALTE